MIVANMSEDFRLDASCRAKIQRCVIIVLKTKGGLTLLNSNSSRAAPQEEEEVKKLGRSGTTRTSLQEDKGTSAKGDKLRLLSFIPTSPFI